MSITDDDYTMTIQSAYLQLQNVTLPYIKSVTIKYLNMMFCRPGKMLLKTLLTMKDLTCIKQI